MAPGARPTRFGLLARKVLFVSVTTLDAPSMYKGQSPRLPSPLPRNSVSLIATRLSSIESPRWMTPGPPVTVRTRLASIRTSPACTSRTAMFDMGPTLVNRRPRSEP